jgi:predicted RNA-binding protein with PUA-like domain
MRHWLIKSEPDVFSIDDLARVRREPWAGVRNYQARNFMWKDMKPGDLALFGAPYPDPTQFDPGSEYFDPKASPEKPRWWLVDFEYVGSFREILTLEAIKTDPVLSEMMVCQRGTRLSINPVDPLHYKRACKLAGFR